MKQVSISHDVKRSNVKLGMSKNERGTMILRSSILIIFISFISALTINIGRKEIIGLTH